MTVREPAWTDQDRAEILALAVHREQLCPCGCGQAYADVTSPESDGPQFTASRVVCRARLALAEQQRAVAESTTADKTITAALVWSVHKSKG